MARFRKGERRSPNAGRRRGSQNRVTKEVRAAVLEALNSDDGAVEFFRRLKNSRAAEDRRTFATVCARLIPRVVEGELDMRSDTQPAVRIYLPSNGRGPSPSETIEEFQARTSRPESNGALDLDEGAGND